MAILKKTFIYGKVVACFLMHAVDTNEYVRRLGEESVPNTQLMADSLLIVFFSLELGLRSFCCGVTATEVKTLKDKSTTWKRGGIQCTHSGTRRLCPSPAQLAFTSSC